MGRHCPLPPSTLLLKAIGRGVGEKRDGLRVPVPPSLGPPWHSRPSDLRLSTLVPWRRRLASPSSSPPLLSNPCHLLPSSLCLALPTLNATPTSRPSTRFRRPEAEGRGSRAAPSLLLLLRLPLGSPLRCRTRTAWACWCRPSWAC